MLILTRRPGESFFIGDDIEVVILGGCSQVRLGIEAPRTLTVTRGELMPPEEKSVQTTEARSSRSTSV